MGYQIITGMWACDLQSSSDLNNEQKEEFNKVIKEKCEYLYKKLGIEIVVDQFRGDGLLLIFDVKDMQTKLIDFANNFCEEINKDKEEGKIKDNFYIRTYIHIGSVHIDENASTAVGKDVDEFCKLVDNKQVGRIYIKEKYSAVLICTNKCYECLSDDGKVGFSEFKIEDVLYYKREYQPKNLVISLMTSEDEYSVEIKNAIREEFKKEKVKIVNGNYEYDKLVVISNESERKKIYESLSAALKIVASKVTKNKWKGYSIVLIDLEKSDSQITDFKPLLQYINNERKYDFSNLLVWSDVSLDEFKKDAYFSSTDMASKKYALSGDMRVYYHDFSEKKVSAKNIVYFSKLNQRCIYLHSFDYGGIKLIKDIAPYADLESYLRQQLEMGLILCDGVIIHSAEVLRSEVVYNILKDYEPLISDGSIKLLFSSQVNDIKDDFKDYIEEKIREYDISEFGKSEASSLREAMETQGQLEKTIDLLSKCPKMIKRDGDGTSNLEELINADLAANVIDVILDKKEYAGMGLLKYNYNLFQLLTAKYVDKESVFLILPEEIKQSIIRKIEQLVNGVISASIVNSVLEEMIPPSIKESFKWWYYALKHRVNYLYAKINTGKFMYMEYLQVLWRGSIFDYAKFYAAVAGCVNVNYVGCDVVKKIRCSEKWEDFKSLYYNAQLLNQFMNASGFDGSELYNYYIKKAQYQLTQILN